MNFLKILGCVSQVGVQLNVESTHEKGKMKEEFYHEGVYHGYVGDWDYAWDYVPRL